MDFKEIGINTSKQVDSAQDRGYWRALLNAALNLQGPLKNKINIKDRENVFDNGSRAVK